MERRGWAMLIAAFTALGAVLRVPALNAGLWFDEVVTLVEFARPPLLDVITVFPDSNNHPLYSVLAHLSLAVFGESAWALRFPAVIFGVVSIPLLYRVGRSVTSPFEAALAALLMAVAYHAVWFAQNARGYTALLVFTLLSSRFALRLAEQGDTRTAIAWGVTVGLGIYTHLTMAFTAAAHVLVWGAQLAMIPGREARMRGLRTVVIAGGTAGLLAALLYAPMLDDVYAFFLTAPEPTQAIAVATPRWAVLEALRGMQAGFGVLGTAGVLVALAFLTVGGLSYLVSAPVATLLFTLPAPITLAATVVLHSPLRPRFFFSLAGFALLFLVRGAVLTGRALARTTNARLTIGDAIGAAFVVLIAAGSIWSLGENYRLPKQDFEGAMRYIEAEKRADDRVATGGLARYPFEHYLVRDWTAVERVEEFQTLLDSGRRVWAVYSFIVYMQPELVALIERRCPVARVFPGTLGGGDVIVCVTP